MKQNRFSIKWLILSLLAFAMIGTFVGAVISSIIVSKNNLEKNYLAENKYYAQKLASTTDSLFANMFMHLKAESIEKDLLLGNKMAINKRLNHMLKGTNFYNSTWLVDKTGKIVASAPASNIVGTKPNSIGIKEALEKKEPLISDPYFGKVGKLILLISVPIFDDQGRYKGFLAGTIYLQENNSLKKILGDHPQNKNDSYVFVVDSKANIIYHPDPLRIGDNVIENKIVREVLKGRNGSNEVVNTKGISMLAGYAPSISKSHWGIISQTPKKSVIGPTLDVAIRVGLFTFPFIIFVFILSLYLLKRIVNPLRDLAGYAHQVTRRRSIRPPVIPEKYYELNELKQTIFLAVDYFQKKLHVAETESNRDPLTNLYNRRFLEKKIKNMNHFSMILLDIDHFKLVNDEFGHSVGDEVIKYLSRMLSDEIKESDYCLRLGGEEFLILLPEMGLNEAVALAERIRNRIASMNSPTGMPITVSMGVGNVPTTAGHFSEAFNITDQALYEAKKQGRNKVISTQ